MKIKQSITANNLKENVGLAGEYAVASELCKRGFYAQLTLGNHKKIDLLVEGTNKLFRVSVKTKTGYAWPKVTGIYNKGDILVLVDLKNKNDNDRPDFYILDVSRWKRLITSLKKTKGKGAKINKLTNTIYFDPWEGYDKGWVGCSINLNNVKQFKECWNYIK